jgi:hypothetical protein
VRAGGLLVQFGLSNYPRLISFPQVLKHILSVINQAITQSVNVDSSSEALSDFQVLVLGIN